MVSSGLFACSLRCASAPAGTRVRVCLYSPRFGFVSFSFLTAQSLLLRWLVLFSRRPERIHAQLFGEQGFPRHCLFNFRIRYSTFSYRPFAGNRVSPWAVTFSAVPTSATDPKKLCHIQRQPNATTKARNQFAPIAFLTSSNIAGHSDCRVRDACGVVLWIVVGLAGGVNAIPQGDDVQKSRFTQRTGKPCHTTLTYGF